MIGPAARCGPARSRLRGAGRPELTRIAAILRRETVGGALMLAAAAAAVLWANTPWAAAYFDLRDTTVGPAALHLDLTLGQWAAEGLLAVFFFVAGLEIKRELVVGQLRDPRRAMLPVLAAVGGMAAPAVIFTVIAASTGSDAARGWAIPTATDIAFAVAVLAVAGSRLPAAFRTFLLTLAVVDDLLAIIIIAVYYAGDVTGWPLAAAMLPLAGFTLLIRRARSGWLLVPLAVTTWALVHASGVHATVTGVLLALTVPVRAGQGAGPRWAGVAERLDRWVRPLSAGVAVPVFAFLSAGVAVVGTNGSGTAFTDPVTYAVAAGLLLGKTIGVLATTYLLARFTRARLDEQLRWVDATALAVLAGIGFTVSLLIADLAFGIGTPHGDHAKIGILLGSLTAGAAAAVLLRRRNRTYLHPENPGLGEHSGAPQPPPARADPTPSLAARPVGQGTDRAGARR